MSQMKLKEEPLWGKAYRYVMCYGFHHCISMLVPVSYSMCWLYPFEYQEILLAAFYNLKGGSIIHTLHIHPLSLSLSLFLLVSFLPRAFTRTTRGLMLGLLACLLVLRVGEGIDHSSSLREKGVRNGMIFFSFF